MEFPEARRPMRRRLGVAIALLAVLGVVGCAQRYAMTLSNGATVTTRGRPRLQGGYYLYQDAEGREQRVNELRVRSIEVQ